MPGAARNAAAKATSASTSPTNAGAAWTTIRRSVLSVAVNVVRNPIVDSDVIDLRNGQLNSLPGATVRYRKADAGIVGYRHPVRISRIDPDIVIVAAGTAAKAGTSSRCLPAVERGCECRGEKVSFVFVVRCNSYAKIIMSTTAENAIITDQSPVLSSVIRSPQLAAISFLTVIRHTVSRLDQRIDAI